MTQINKWPRRLKLFVGCLLVGLCLGCASPEDRVERPILGDEDPREVEVQEAFSIAQSAIDKTGLGIDLSELGDLGNLETILASPEELENIPEPAIQDAIAAMYLVLDASGDETPIMTDVAITASPFQVVNSSILSKTDQILMHVNLAHFYLSDALRKLQTEKGDLFEIDFIEGQYDFHLSESAKKQFDNLQPEEYLLQFSMKQRQVIIDAVTLLTSARIRVTEQPGTKDIYGKLIQDQATLIDRRISRQDALYHLDQGLKMAKQLAPDLATSIQNLNKNVADIFTNKLLDKVSKWGFSIGNRDEVEARIRQLVSQ